MKRLFLQRERLNLIPCFENTTYNAVQCKYSISSGDGRSVDFTRLILNRNWRKARIGIRNSHSTRNGWTKWRRMKSYVRRPTYTMAADSFHQRFRSRSLNCPVVWPRGNDYTWSWGVHPCVCSRARVHPTVRTRRTFCPLTLVSLSLPPPPWPALSCKTKGLWFGYWLPAHFSA